MRIFAQATICLAVVTLSIGGALAADGQPVPWQLGFQNAATEHMQRLTWFNNYLLYIVTAICIFVLGLMLYVMLRFNARANPTPSTTTHNTLLEVVWTIIPILILVAIAVPSFRLLYFQEQIPETDLTVKAVGYQWYWGYEYPDHGGFAYDSIMLEDSERTAGQPRLLATDNALILPENTTVKVLVTAADVLHSWTVPSFGVKVDAVPGQVNALWFKTGATGTYYGQCSELCGVRHAFMPIEVKVVSKAEFESWVKQAQAEYARLNQFSNHVADAGMHAIGVNYGR